jgi:hypothetical protein
MPLVLKQVAPARGFYWLIDALRLFRRRPVAFVLMLASFVGFAMLLLLLPSLIGVPVLLMLPPLLSLGFMVASQSALLDGPVHPRQFIEPLFTDKRRRRSLLLLCALYAVMAFGIGVLCYFVAGDDGQQLFAYLADHKAEATDTSAVLDLFSQPGIENATLLGNGLLAVLAVPFWFAPALVHWGGQGAGQALFSSSLALWRSKGAFLAYGLACAFASIATTTVVGILLSLLGSNALGTAIAAGFTLSFWALMFVSQLFTFNDNFGASTPTLSAPAAEPGSDESHE